MFKLIIAGGRNYADYPKVQQQALAFLKERGLDTVTIVSGGAKGADALGEQFAKENGFPIERHNADWNQHGRAAGPIRNKQMAKTADGLLAFWDGTSKGTMSMINLGHRHDLDVVVVTNDLNDSTSTSH